MNNEPNDNQLEEILKNLAKEGRPDQKFQKVLLKEVKEKYKKIYGHKPWILGIFRLKMQLASAFALLTLTTTTLYAYNSDSIVSGDLLYPLKRSAETVEGYFADNEEEKSNYYSKMAERRTRELDYIEVESENYKTTIRETERMVKMAKTELDKVEKKESPKVDKPERPIENNRIIIETEKPKRPVEKNTDLALPEIISIENNAKAESDDKSANKFNDINKSSSELIELEPDFNKLEESINIPITPEEKINITEQIETRSDDKTTIIRSRIQKVESDIKRIKEEQDVFNFRSNSSKIDLEVKIKTGR